MHTNGRGHSHAVNSNRRPFAAKGRRDSRLRRLLLEPLEDRRLLSAVEWISEACAPSGTAGNSDSYSTRLALSADGRYTTFESIANNLVSGDVNDAANFVCAVPK